jgi:RNA polymerase primary sigma factor
MINFREVNENDILKEWLEFREETAFCEMSPQDKKYCIYFDEIAEKIDLPEDKIIDAMKVNGRHISVDAPFVEGEDNSLLDIMINDDAPMADRTLVMESLRDEISRALTLLNERERNIIECFFGIGQPEMTLEEIGERFGLTRERVRQIKEKAIRRLRHNTKSKMLKTYLGQ